MTTRIEQQSARANRDDYDRQLSAAGHRMQWKLGENSRRAEYAWFWEGHCSNCGAEMSVGATWSSCGGVRDARHVPCSGPGTDVLTVIEADRSAELTQAALDDFSRDFVAAAENARNCAVCGDKENHLAPRNRPVHLHAPTDGHRFEVEPAQTSEDVPRDAAQPSTERTPAMPEEATLTVGEAHDLESSIKHVGDAQNVIDKTNTSLEQLGGNLQSANVGGPAHGFISAAMEKLAGAVSDLQQVENLLRERIPVADSMSAVQGRVGDEAWVRGAAVPTD